jgi:hypothetical protein
MVGYDKKFGKIGVNAFFGGNTMRRSNEYLGLNGSGFNYPSISGHYKFERKNLQTMIIQNQESTLFSDQLKFPTMIIYS